MTLRMLKIIFEGGLNSIVGIMTGHRSAETHNSSGERIRRTDQPRSSSRTNTVKNSVPPRTRRSTAADFVASSNHFRRHRRLNSARSLVIVHLRKIIRTKHNISNHHTHLRDVVGVQHRALREHVEQGAHSLRSATNVLIGLGHAAALITICLENVDSLKGNAVAHRRGIKPAEAQTDRRAIRGTLRRGRVELRLSLLARATPHNRLPRIRDRERDARLLSLHILHIPRARDHVSMVLRLVHKRLTTAQVRRADVAPAHTGSHRRPVDTVLREVGVRERTIVPERGTVLVIARTSGREVRARRSRVRTCTEGY